MTEKKIDLIAQLLAKAERTTPEEAEALTEAAERLMVKYGIEQAIIDERRAREGRPTEKIIESKKLFTGVYALDLRDMGAAVAFGLGTLRPLQANYPGVGSVLYLVGFESDVKQGERLIASLELQAMVAMRTWWRAERRFYSWASESDKRRARSGFIRGFGAGARARIEANRRTIIEESSTGTELVLASRLDKVNEAIAAMGDGTARDRRAPDADSYHDGVRAGQEANTGERVTTTGKALTR